MDKILFRRSFYMKNIREMKFNIKIFILFLILISIQIKAVGSYSAMSVTITQQQKKISGIVTDRSGEPIIGCSIMLKGETIGTITDIDGKFSLNAPQNGVLKISYIGFKTIEQPINGKMDFKIILEENNELLNEVVVVGYGVQRKASVTGAVASVQTKDIVAVKSPNISNTLVGQLPGLRAVQRTGAPGDDVANIDIRGFGNALVIVDGVERDFSQIDANDVESISILKDASAAVYGFKGANGVILVTTKKGSVGKTTINYNGYYGIQKATRFPKLYNSYEYAMLYNEAEMNIGVVAPYSQDELDKYKAGNDPAYPNTNWWKAATQNAPEVYHNLNVTGGNEKVKYYFSLGYLSQDGIWASNDYKYKKYNLRSNISAQITKGLTASLQLSGSLDSQNKPYDQEPFKAIYKAHPNLPVYANNTAPYWQDTGDNANPVQITNIDEVGYNKRDRRYFNGSLTLNWELPWVKGLSAKALLAYDYTNTSTKDWFKKYNEYQYDATSNVYNQTTRNALTTLSSEMSNSFTPTQQYSLNYINSFGKNSVSALLLWEMTNYHSDWIGVYREYDVGAKDQIDAGVNTNKDNSGNASEAAHEGLVGRINYDYAGKYLAEASFRYDGSYKFAPGSRWGFFPAFSLGWRMSEESFIKNNFNFVDNLKIRASYGKVGDEGDFSPFQYLSGYYYPSGSYVMGSGGKSNGAISSGMPNTNLTWYTSTTFDLGFDAQILKGLLSVEFDVFERRRNGLLATRNLTLPTSFGLSLPQENLNSDKTRGFELVLGHRHKIRDFFYEIKANLSMTRDLNRYVEGPVYGNLYENWRNNGNGRYKSITWGYKAIGQFQSFEEILNSPIEDGNGNKSLLPGDIKYKDLNNDGIIDDKDKKPIGHSNMPDMFYGLNFSSSWKGIDFTMLFQGAAGAQIFVGETFTDPFIQQGLGNGVVRWLNRWHRVDPSNVNSEWISGDMPAVRPSGFALNNQPSTWNLLKEDYLRLKTIELGYTLPSSLLKNVGISSARIYINALNPLTFTRGGFMKYMDPENSNANLQYYPQMKSYNFGFNLSF